MFKFGFSSNTNDTDGKDEKGLTYTSTLEWLPAKEISPLQNSVLRTKLIKTEVFKISDNYIHYLSLSDVLEILKSDENVEESIKHAENSHSDLIPAKYEGGLKIWECTYDLAAHLVEQKTYFDLKNKSVLDLGCGAGILGILALKLGAEHVDFQDYNADVLRLVTSHNVNLNKDSDRYSHCKYFCGDWESFSSLNNVQYDIILSSETIYNPDNYLKLLNTLKRKLKKTGIALIAAKSYYFGVGGSVREFEALIEKQGIFNSSVKWKNSQGVQREILHLTFKNNS